MSLCAICGSTASDSSNLKLLNYINETFARRGIDLISELHLMPLFRAQESALPDKRIIDFKRKVSNSSGIIISTPEYIHTIPAALKSALEWCYRTNEFAGKKVIPIVYTPVAPRGKGALATLENVLGALHADLPSKMLIHKTDIDFDAKGKCLFSEVDDMLEATIELLK